MIARPMQFRPPTPYELYVWTAFRGSCRRAGAADPGPAPAKWPADPETAARVIEILAAATHAGEPLTGQQMQESFGGRP